MKGPRRGETNSKEPNPKRFLPQAQRVLTQCPSCVRCSRYVSYRFQTMTTSNGWSRMSSRTQAGHWPSRSNWERNAMSPCHQRSCPQCQAQKVRPGLREPQPMRAGQPPPFSRLPRAPQSAFSWGPQSAASGSRMVAGLARPRHQMAQLQRLPSTRKSIWPDRAGIY